MANPTIPRILPDASPKGLIYLCLFGGLGLIVYGAATMNWLFLVAAALLPLAIMVLFQVIQHPVWSYLFAGIIFCYFSAIYRYANIPGLSGILDIVLGLSFFSLLVNTANRNPDIHWKNAINALTITYFIWMVYCVFSLLSPYTEFHNPITSRGVFLSIPLTYLLSSILMCTPKRLKIALFLLGIFVATVALKAAYQRYRGFDAAETRFLVEEGAWLTHIVLSGARYFSFYTDAGNLGSSMGMFTLIFGLLALVIKHRWARLFCLAAALAACYTMFLSGTRGAMVVPLGGLLLYTFINKSWKLILASIVMGILTFSFFYFTDIGDENRFIRRMRTAFRPTEDASFNVRLENQKILAHYLKEKPLGVGIGGKIYDNRRISNIHRQDAIPPDSYFVNVWIESGIIGLFLYIGILAFILLRCCYLLMFRIQNKQLRQILAALLCGVFGLWLNGYVGRGMGMQPSQFLIALFLAFVLNGPLMDKMLKKDEILL